MDWLRSVFRKWLGFNEIESRLNAHRIAFQQTTQRLDKLEEEAEPNLKKMLADFEQGLKSDLDKTMEETRLPIRSKRKKLAKILEMRSKESASS